MGVNNDFLLDLVSVRLDWLINAAVALVTRFRNRMDCCRYISETAKGTKLRPQIWFTAVFPNMYVTTVQHPHHQTTNSVRPYCARIYEGFPVLLSTSEFR